MADQTTESDPHGMHDWHSAEYVDHWISSDATNDDERRSWLRRVAALLPFPKDQAIRVLDVGAGYALLTREVLDEFPSSTVVLHDFSEPMFDHARERLADAADRISFVAGDLRDPSWTSGIEGTFDAVVSSIAIHNVRDPAIIKRVYADIRPLVAPGGCFYNIDFVMPAGPLAAGATWGERAGAFPEGDPEELPTFRGHFNWLLAAGFDEADCLFHLDSQTLVAGFVA